MSTGVSLVGSSSPEDFVKQVKRPRKIILLERIDEMIKTLSDYLDEGDILVDGGDEWYPNSIRSKELESKGITFVGLDMSGEKEENHKTGSSLMPGGAKDIITILIALQLQKLT